MSELNPVFDQNSVLVWRNEHAEPSTAWVCKSATGTHPRTTYGASSAEAIQRWQELTGHAPNQVWHSSSDAGAPAPKPAVLTLSGAWHFVRRAPVLLGPGWVGRMLPEWAPQQLNFYRAEPTSLELRFHIGEPLTEGVAIVPLKYPVPEEDMRRALQTLLSASQDW